MRSDVILATISDEKKNSIRKISITDYQKMLSDKDKDSAKKRIAEMIYHRFHGRYIKPFFFKDRTYQRHYKNGFSMMASGCLLIEALQAFYRGWKETQTSGGDLFDNFFAATPSLKAFKNKGFYKHVRCGIMHQAETTGGFRIVRAGPLFDPLKKAINSQKFLQALDDCLKQYRNLLTKSEWDSEVWDNFRTKMRHIIRHCE